MNSLPKIIKASCCRFRTIHSLIWVSTMTKFCGATKAACALDIYKRDKENSEMKPSEIII